MSIKFTKPDIGLLQTTSTISDKTAVAKVMNRMQVLSNAMDENNIDFASDVMSENNIAFVGLYNESYFTRRIEIRNYIPSSSKSNNKDTIFIKIITPINDLARIKVTSAIGFKPTSDRQKSIHSFEEYVNQQLFGSLNNLPMDVYDFAISSKIEFDTKEDRLAFTRDITSIAVRDESFLEKLNPSHPRIISAKTIHYTMIHYYSHSFCYSMEAFRYPKNHVYRGYQFSKFCIRRIDDTSINFEIHLTPNEPRHYIQPLDLKDFNVQELQMNAASIVKDIFTDSVFYNEIPYLKDYIDQLEYHPRLHK